MLLGVDAGGSHVEIGTSCNGGPVEQRTTVSPAPGAASDPKGLARAIFEATTDLFPDREQTVDRIVVGAAGTGNKKKCDTLQRAISDLWPAATVVVTTDIDIALQSCFPFERGILLGAGTGSFAARRNADGSTERVGGLGPKLGDEGSAFHLGKMALQEALLNPDESRELGAALRTRLGGQTLEETLDSWTPGEIATLSRTVCEMALAGDGTASRLVANSTRELLKLVSLLGEKDDSLPVAFVGGLLSNRSPVKRAVVSFLSESDQFEYSDRTVDPVSGALSLASRLS